MYHLWKCNSLYWCEQNIKLCQNAIASRITDSHNTWWPRNRCAWTKIVSNSRSRECPCISEREREKPSVRRPALHSRIWTRGRRRPDIIRVTQGWRNACLVEPRPPAYSELSYGNTRCACSQRWLQQPKSAVRLQWLARPRPNRTLDSPRSIIRRLRSPHLSPVATHLSRAFVRSFARASRLRSSKIEGSPEISAGRSDGSSARVNVRVNNIASRLDFDRSILRKTTRPARSRRSWSSRVLDRVEHRVKRRAIARARAHRVSFESISRGEKPSLVDAWCKRSERKGRKRLRKKGFEGSRGEKWPPTRWASGCRASCTYRRKPWARTGSGGPRRRTRTSRSSACSPWRATPNSDAAWARTACSATRRKQTQVTRSGITRGNSAPRSIWTRLALRLRQNRGGSTEMLACGFFLLFININGKIPFCVHNDTRE